MLRRSRNFFTIPQEIEAFELFYNAEMPVETFCLIIMYEPTAPFTT
jgi:hypothetical protein